MPGAAAKLAAEATLITPPPARCAETRDEHVTTMHRAPQVDAECPSPILDRDVPHWTTADAYTGVVHDQAHRSVEPALSLLGHRLDRIEVRHVADHSQRDTTRPDDGLGRLVGPVGHHVGAHDLTAATSQFDGEGPTDPAASARDHRPGSMRALRPAADPGESHDHFPVMPTTAPSEPERRN